MKIFIYIFIFLNLISCKVLKNEEIIGSYKTKHIYDVQDEITLFPNNKFEYKWYAGLAGNGSTSGIWNIKKNRLFLTSDNEEEPIRVLIIKQPQITNFKTFKFIIKDEFDDEIAGCSCVAKYNGEFLSAEVSDFNGICSFDVIDIDEIQIYFIGKEDFILKDEFGYGSYEVFLQDKKPYKLVFDNERVRFKKSNLKIKNKSFYKTLNLKGKYTAFFERKENVFEEANFNLVFLSDKHYIREIYQYENKDNPIDEIKGSIEKINNSQGETYYYLSEFVFIQPKVKEFIQPKDKLDSISLKLPRVIMEIKKENSDTLKFRITYSSQLNVTLSEGILVKVD